MPDFKIDFNYKRILLKLSGEVLAGEKRFGHDFEVINNFALKLKKLRESGLEIAIVVGGGNLIRGRDIKIYGVDNVRADYMGMLGTVMNAIALKDALERIDVKTEILSAVAMPPIADLFNRERAIKFLSEGKILIFAAGTGHPFFSTDTASALRCAEIKADCMIKGTKVDGIYDSDPVKNPNAKFIPFMTYSDALKNNINVMDAAAFAICRDNKIPVIVTNIQNDNWAENLINNNIKCTLVREA